MVEWLPRPPRILVYADMRTHHAQAFVEGLRASGLVVQAVSSTAIDTTATAAELEHGHAEGMQSTDLASRLRRRVVDSGLNLRVRALVQRHAGRVDPLQVIDTALGRLRLGSQRERLTREVRSFRPDVVHALRLPYEGLIALSAIAEDAGAPPVSISTWGQDFRYQAVRDPMMRRWLRRALVGAAGIHVDAMEDLARAGVYGLPEATPWIFAAGNFGIDTASFFPEPKQDLVLYPRGLRRYVNHRAFLALVSANEGSGIDFVGVGLESDEEARTLAARSGMNLRLVPELPRKEYAPLLRQARAVVSPATSDGTPNSVLEAIAAGCHAIAGDIAPVRDLARRSGGEVLLLDPADTDAWGLRLDTLSWWSQPPPATARVPQEFDREVNAQRFPSFFADVLLHHDMKREGRPR